MTDVEVTEDAKRPGYDLPPALFNHCVDVFAYMWKHSTEDPENDNGRLWEGYTTKVFSQELHLSVPYYTNVMSRLKAMGCVVLLRRGGGGSKSLWSLLKQPELKEFYEAVDTIAPQRRSKSEAWTQQASDLSSRITALESNVATLMEIIQELVEAKNA